MWLLDSSVGMKGWIGALARAVLQAMNQRLLDDSIHRTLSESRVKKTL
jgi:hypothetical protein